MGFGYESGSIETEHKAWKEFCAEHDQFEVYLVTAEDSCGQVGASLATL